MKTFAKTLFFILLIIQICSAQWVQQTSGITFIGEKENNAVPTKYLLAQNYPNPFNPSTKISWQLPVGNIATLKIYDILGREIITLVNEYKPAGRYETEFNAALLPSGVYLYRLSAESLDGKQNYSCAEKMILLK